MTRVQIDAPGHPPLELAVWHDEPTGEIRCMVGRFDGTVVCDGVVAEASPASPVGGE